MKSTFYADAHKGDLQGECSARVRVRPIRQGADLGEGG